MLRVGLILAVLMMLNLSCTRQRSEQAPAGSGPVRALGVALQENGCLGVYYAYLSGGLSEPTWNHSGEACDASDLYRVLIASLPEVP
jgi:hypothetical protein